MPAPNLSASPQQVMMRIDAHHHLWRYVSEEFTWITDNMSPLKCDFLIPQLQEALASAQINASIAVQSRQSIEETEWLIGCAASTEAIVGVVGWLPIADIGLEKLMDKFADSPKFVGVREIVQGQPAGFFEQSDFNRGIQQLTDLNLTYDILIYAYQLPEVTRFVDRHPQQRFVLNHAAKPPISRSELEPWSSHLKELARRENVVCKISGLVTEAKWSHWTLNTLRPYLDVSIEAFGTNRILAGSDWPVCLVASGYSEWWKTLECYFCKFSEEEISCIFGGNALASYPRAICSKDMPGGRS